MWPLVSRSVRTITKPLVVLPGISSRHKIQPLYIYRTFTTSLEDSALPLSPSNVLEPESISTPLSNVDNNMEWEKYVASIEKNEDIPIEKFHEVAFNTQMDREMDIDEKIERLQHILRDLHVRLEEQPTLKRSFVLTCNYLMKTYIDEGSLKNASLVFEGLADSKCAPSATSMQTIINGIRKQGTKADLYKFMQSIERRGLGYPKEVYLTAIRAFKHFKDLRGCQYYIAKMKKEGLELDEVHYRIMMVMYRQADRPENVLDLYKTMKKNKVEITDLIYNIVLSSLSLDSKKYRKETKQVFEEMKELGHKPNASAYLSMHWDPLDAIKDMNVSEYAPTIRDYNEFLAHYVKKNSFPQALDVYNLIKKDKNVQMDVFSYCIVMDVIVKDLEQSPALAFELYEEMKCRDIAPDAVVYTSLLHACNRAQDLEHAMLLLEEMESFGVKPNEYTFNSLLSILATMAGTSFTDLDRASLIWEKMTTLGVHPDKRSYNTYLSIISRLVKPAEYNNSNNNELSSSSLWGEEEEDINVPKTVREMLRMYRYMRRNHHETIQPDFATYTIVINSLSVAGQLRSALQVYNDAKMARVTLPVSAYNEMMRGLQRGGKMSEAMNIWYDMKIFGVLPNSDTYEIVLEACEQLGLSESLTSIRNQRKADMNRLLELDVKKDKRDKRMKKPFK